MELKSASNPIAEITAEASPTSSVEYKRAATIQKANPSNAPSAFEAIK
jgi:hypothetical protein